MPGWLTLAGFILVIAVWVWWTPSIAPSTDTRYTHAERFRAALDSWPAVLLFVLIIGGIYGGIFTATEAAAVCVVAATLIGFAQRKLTLAGLWDAVKETCIQTSAIFLIAAAAKIFVAFIALTPVATATSSCTLCDGSRSRASTRTRHWPKFVWVWYRRGVPQRACCPH